MAECVNSCIPTECTDLPNQGCKKRYIPSVTSALIVGSILGLLQAVFLVFSAKFVLNIMGVKSVSAIIILISLIKFILPAYFHTSYNVFIHLCCGILGIPNAKTCSSLPNNKISWCPCCAIVSGHARGFPGIQGHEDTIICYW